MTHDPIHPRGIARSERLDGWKGPDVLVPVVTRMKRWGNLFNFNMVGCSAENGPMVKMVIYDGYILWLHIMVIYDGYIFGYILWLYMMVFSCTRKLEN
jgi:hypothetical protein